MKEYQLELANRGKGVQKKEVQVHKLPTLFEQRVRATVDPSVQTQTRSPSRTKLSSMSVSKEVAVSLEQMMTDAKLSALDKLSEQDSQLVAYIKYDSALSREQNVDLRRVTSLANVEDIKVKPGVILKQFAPERASEKARASLRASDAALQQVKSSARHSQLELLL